MILALTRNQGFMAHLINLSALLNVRVRSVRPNSASHFGLPLPLPHGLAWPPNLASHMAPHSLSLGLREHGLPHGLPWPPTWPPNVASHTASHTASHSASWSMASHCLQIWPLTASQFGLSHGLSHGRPRVRPWESELGGCMGSCVGVRGRPCSLRLSERLCERPCERPCEKLH